MKDKLRVSFYLEEEGQSALSAIKQHYGTESNANAVRRAIVEHAKQIKRVEETAKPTITYSGRVY